MRSFRFALSIGVTFALLASVLVSSALSAQAPTVSAATSWSVDKVVHPNGGWSSECGSDYCGIQIVQLAHIPARVLSDTSDVVVQVTMDVRTTPGSDALVSVGLHRAAGAEAMHPKSFPVSAPQRTTTTLRWVRHDVGAPANGGYDVWLDAAPRRRGASYNKEISTTGKKLTVHVSVTP